MPTSEALCYDCGRWYDVYEMYAGLQTCCPSCRAKREREKCNDAMLRLAECRSVVAAAMHTTAMWFSDDITVDALSAETREWAAKEGK